MSRYGIPYMGSKNSIAEEIVNLLPKRDNLYDLFCGGCAITHCAIEKQKYKNYYINDIQPNQAQFFIDCLNGKYKNENRWISREEFKEKHRTDPYISCVWSFGNKGYTYIYGKDVEPIKKALHYAIFFNDNTYLEELGIHIGTWGYIENKAEKRKVIIREVRKQIGDKKLQLQSLENLERLQSLERLERLQSLERLENGERLDNIKSIANKSLSERITATCKSYDEVEIKPNSVIYCDIPYEGTSAYLGNSDNTDDRYKNNFDYNKFYEWANSQKELVVISSYEIKDSRFACVWEREKVSLLNQHAGKKKVVIERLYVPTKQLDLWKETNIICKQLSLFDMI